MPSPSPEWVAGSATAMERTCPVQSCQAEPGAICTTPLMMRPRHGSKEAPTPIVLSGPHFERVMGTDWTPPPRP